MVGFLAMGVQAVNTVRKSRPIKQIDTTGTKIEYTYGRPEGVVHMQKYETWSGTTDHKHAVQNLLDVTRMASINQLYFRAACEENSATPLSRMDAVSSAETLLRLITNKFGWFSVLETAWNANVQASGL